MQQQAETATPPSFANLLAALAAPASKPTPAWNDDDLEDDVATLSYERALRARSRYLAADLSDRSLTQPAHLATIDFPEASPAPAVPPSESAVRQSSVRLRAETAPRPSTAFEQNLKSASITIRMSRAECAQLHNRAAEAGLTVSAYLRSCTFEAESLRALVKDTMAQLNAANSTAKQPLPAPVRRSRLQWLMGLFAPWRQVPRHLARA